jgi:hypothetical protein
MKKNLKSGSNRQPKFLTANLRVLIKLSLTVQNRLVLESVSCSLVKRIKLPFLEACPDDLKFPESWFCDCGVLIVIINLFGSRISRCFLRKSYKVRVTSPLSQSPFILTRLSAFRHPSKINNRLKKSQSLPLQTNSTLPQLPEYIHSDHMQQPNNQYLNQQPYGARAPQQNPGPNQFMRPP